MSIYIKGMEMPKEGFVEILIRDDGTVQQTGQSYRIDGTDYYTPYVGEMPVIYKAVPVPPHGRLIDADKIGLTNFEIILCQKGNPYKNALEMLLKKIENAPTIIPAEECE